MKLASGCRLPVFYLHGIVLDPLKSNLPIYKISEFTSGCRLPVSYVALIVFNPLEWN